MHGVNQVVDEALELLYGSPEDEIKGINKLLSLLVDEPVGILDDVIQNHQLIAALARLLGEDSPRPIELTFAIGKIFLSLSLNEEFHEVLSSHRVGALALGVVKLECKRARHRVPSDMSSDSSTAHQYSFSSKQERVIFVCLSILDNLSDDITLLRKMIKKSLVEVLTRCVPLESSENLHVTISLLKKASIFEETAHELSRAGCTVISKLGKLLCTPLNTAIRNDIVLLFFNLSFHEGCLTLISSMDIHARLLAFLQKSSLCTDTLQLIYHLSSREEDQHKLYEAGISPSLLDLLTHIPKDEHLNAALAGLLANVSNAMHHLIESQCHG
jgi:hypothetical protein